MLFYLDTKGLLKKKNEEFFAFSVSMLEIAFWPFYE